MEIRIAITFLLLYYLRPQDWVPGIVGYNIIQPFMAMSFVVLAAARSQQSPLRGLVRTPHDWIMLLYLTYVTFTAPDAFEAFKGFLPGVAFYFFAVQSITSWPRLVMYLKWWNFALIAVAALAVLSQFGFDPTNANPITQRMGGRLCLGTWLHRNPNALGHSVVAVIPLSFALYFWRSSINNRMIVFPTIVSLAFYCLWQTQSKGAYVVGGGLIVLMAMTGRNWLSKLIIAAVALTLGLSALSFMPRMTEMGDLRSDEGVMGRLLAWDIARTVSKTNPTGEGWKQFHAIIEWEERNQKIFVPKATHSSYVQLSADLGRYGLFIYLAGLWCAMRTLIAIRPSTNEQHRCQIALFYLVAATAISNWMINREYHTEYFLLLGACAAMHRLRKAEDFSPDTVSDPVSNRAETPVSLMTSNRADLQLSDYGEDGTMLQHPRKAFWNRFGIADAAITAALTWLTFLTWDYLMRTI